MTHLRLLDLFCKAGGATKGYQRAGFYVVGVDIEPQPHYCGDEFAQVDALAVLRGETSINVSSFVAIHASPPCQRYSVMSQCRPGLADNYPDLIDPVRNALEATGLLWVIENVPRAPLHNPVMLCGFMFGLRLYRHRMFETNFPLTPRDHPHHSVPGSSAGHWKPGQIISVSGHFAPISEARQAMEIDWMIAREMAEAIPPAYTEWIGKQLMVFLGCN